MSWINRVADELTYTDYIWLVVLVLLIPLSFFIGGLIGWGMFLLSAYVLAHILITAIRGET